MPVHPDALDTMNQILAGHFGPLRSSVAPDSYRVRLWIDNPLGDSPSEADWGGYTPVVWDSDDWLTPDGGEVDSDGLADFGVPSSGGSDAARFWSLEDVTTGDIKYSGPLASRISIPDDLSGPSTVRIRLTVPYGGRDN